MRKSAEAVILMLFVAGAALAQDATPPVGAPEFKVGDSWEYARKDLVDNSDAGSYVISITSIDGDVVTVTQKKDGDTQPTTITTDRNWSLPTDINGQHAIYRYLDFPLTPGKSWQTSMGWRNADGDPFENDVRFTVAGPEQITVPAGTFDAVKIVGVGRWSKLNGRATSVSRLTLWYAPQVKRFVRYDLFRAAYAKGSPHGHSDQLTTYRLQH